MTGVLIKGEIWTRTDTHRVFWKTTWRQTGRMPCEDRGQIRVSCLQAKGCLRLPGPPEARRGTEWILPHSLQKESTLLTPWFQTSRLQDSEAIKLRYFKSPSVWHFAMAALRSQQTRCLLLSCISPQQWAQCLLKRKMNALRAAGVSWKWRWGDWCWAKKQKQRKSCKVGKEDI